jgi:alpha-D-xyloside xylohydrolase
VDRAGLVAAQPARPLSDFLPKNPRRIERVQRVQKVKDRLKLSAQDDLEASVAIEIVPVASNIVRLHIGPKPARPSRLLSADAPSRSEWTLEELEAGWSVTTQGLKLLVEREPYRLRLCDPSGEERFAEQPHDMDIRGGYHHFPSGHSRGLRWLTAGLRPGEALFGLGEHFGPLNKRGQAFASWTVDAYGVRSDRAYKNLPLLLSSAGYAVFFDMTAPLYYELGQSSSAAWQVTARADHLRAYLIVADDFAGQLRAYHQLTGTPAVPPAWSFGLWMSRWGYRNRAEVMEVARRMRAEKIPCDVIHIDPYWLRYPQGHHCDFTWNEEAFPDPEGMIAELKAMGFRLSLWESPYVPPRSEMFEEGRLKGYLMVDREGKPALVHGFSELSGAVDFTNPEAVSWFREKNRRVLQMGVAVMKTDFSEDMPADSVPHDGTPAEELHNLYPLLYQRAVFEETQSVHGYGLVWGRSGYAGSQKYPVQWGGDPACTFEDMAASLRGALNWVMSGMCFSSFDMGGFFGIPNHEDPPSPELYVRWAQMGLLFSHSRAHGNRAPREPWAFGPRALEIFGNYARLRYRLLPYLYGAALRAAEGIPLARPLVYDFPKDPTTHHLDSEYLLGPDLLVAPMFKPEGTRQVYLPAGDWYDYWTDNLAHGPGWVEYRAKLETLPLFVRSGALIPMGPDLIYSDQQAWDPLTLDVYQPLQPGVRHAEIRDDHRRASLSLTFEEERVLVEGDLGYPATVRLHRPGRVASVGRLGQAISLKSR